MMSRVTNQELGPASDFDEWDWQTQSIYDALHKDY